MPPAPSGATIWYGPRRMFGASGIATHHTQSFPAPMSWRALGNRKKLPGGVDSLSPSGFSLPLLKPIRHQADVTWARLRLRHANEDKAAPIRRGRVVVEALEVRAFEEDARLACLKSVLALHCDRENLHLLSAGQRAGVVIQLPAVRGPVRALAAVARDSRFSSGAAGSARKRHYVYFQLARFVGAIRQPATVGRNTGPFFRVLGIQYRLRLSFPFHRNHKD